MTPYTDDTIGACFTYNTQVLITSNLNEETFMTYDWSTGMVTVDTSDSALGGLTNTYEIQIKDNAWAWLYTVDTITVTFNFDCSSATFDWFAGFSPIPHIYQNSPDTGSASIPTDSIGTAAGVLLQCGSRQFTYTDQATTATPAWLMLA